MLFIYTLVCPIFFKGPLKYISSLLPFLSYFYGEKRFMYEYVTWEEFSWKRKKRNNRFLSHSNGLVVTVSWDPDIRFQLNVPVWRAEKVKYRLTSDTFRYRDLILLTSIVCTFYFRICLQNNMNSIELTINFNTIRYGYYATKSVSRSTIMNAG